MGVLFVMIPFTVTAHEHILTSTTMVTPRAYDSITGVNDLSRYRMNTFRSTSIIQGIWFFILALLSGFGSMLYVVILACFFIYYLYIRFGIQSR